MDELNLPGNITFQHVKKQNSLEKQINFKSLSKLLDNNSFINPPSQTELDIDKVQEMVDSYIKNPDYLVFKNKITIALLFTLDKENDFLLYLVDGQHRLYMAQKLYNEYDVNDYLTFCYFKTFDIKEIENLFNECNKDSYKNKIVFDKNIIKKIKYEKLKEQLKKKYSDSFSKTKSKSDLKYSICEFLNELNDKEYFLLDIDDLLNDIETKNKKFNKIIDYLGYLENNSDYFYKDELNCITNGITFVLKNNNFIEYLINQSIIPDHIFKNSKNKISPSLRINVWNSVFNDDNEYICPIYKCKNIISNDCNGFQCGYIISKKNNGKLELDNLHPMCKFCYNKMGSTNLETFENNCKKEYQILRSVKKELDKK
jgi:hypothetical protein